MSSFKTTKFRRRWSSVGCAPG